MTTAREILAGDAECAQPTGTLVDVAARKSRDLEVNALPICGEDGRLKGVITDRGIVVQCIAEGVDTNSTKTERLAERKPVAIGADDSIEEALDTMTRRGVRRLPVVDGNGLIGMLSQADVATSLTEDKVGALVETISGAPPNSLTGWVTVARRPGP